MTEKQEILRCSFCNKSQREVKKLIAGPSVFICDDCVLVCVDILNEDKMLEGKNFSTLQELRTTLDETVVGQSKAKEALSVTLYNHCNRLKPDVSGRPKSNILLLGPTGTGKTFLAQKLSEILQIPFALIDATRLRRQSYFKEQDVFKQLLESARQFQTKAEEGIIFLDQIDKLACRNREDGTNRTVQESLLEILTGSRASAALAESPEMDTSQLLFIASGTFTGIEDLIERRLLSQGSKLDRQSDGNNESILSRVCHQDLISYGLIPELVARFAVLTTFGYLTEEEMLLILTQHEGGLLETYVKMFAQEGVKLSFTDQALREITRSAVRRQAGARGLQSILDNLSLELSLAASAQQNLGEITVDEELIISRGL